MERGGRQSTHTRSSSAGSFGSRVSITIPPKASRLPHIDIAEFKERSPARRQTSSAVSNQTVPTTTITLFDSWRTSSTEFKAIFKHRGGKHASKKDKFMNVFAANLERTRSTICWMGDKLFEYGFFHTIEIVHGLLVAFGMPPTANAAKLHIDMPWNYMFLYRFIREWNIYHNDVMNQTNNTESHILFSAFIKYVLLDIVGPIIVVRNYLESKNYRFHSTDQDGISPDTFPDVAALKVRYAHLFDADRDHTSYNNIKDACKACYKRLRLNKDEKMGYKHRQIGYKAEADAVLKENMMKMLGVENHSPSAANTSRVAGSNTENTDDVELKENETGVEPSTAGGGIDISESGDEDRYEADDNEDNDDGTDDPQSVVSMNIDPSDAGISGSNTAVLTHSHIFDAASMISASPDHEFLTIPTTTAGNTVGYAASVLDYSSDSDEDENRSNC